MSQFKFLQIDEEGFPLSGGLRFQDKDLSRILLQNIKLAENRRIFISEFENETYIIENFDQPFVAQHIHKKSLDPQHTEWFVEFPWDIIEPLDFSTFKVDEWDRFHGRSVKNIPFVLSRKAQADFFNLVEEFDDESFTVNHKKYFVRPLLPTQKESNPQQFWQNLYKDSNTQWDLQGPHPALESIISQLKISKCRILNLGCGRGHDAHFLAQRGHLVTGVDVSEEAISQAQSLYGDKENLKFLKLDAFNLPDKFYQSFDLIFEHTFFCAISPDRRKELIKVWKNCLTPRGHLLAFLFTIDHEEAPPYGATEWEYRERLKKNFQFLYWTRLRGTTPRSLSSELIVYAQKNES